MSFSQTVALYSLACIDTISANNNHDDGGNDDDDDDDDDES